MHRVYALNTFLSSVAFIEAWVNEIYKDASEGSLGRIKALSDPCVAMMREFWKEGERATVFGKLQMALMFAGADKFDAGAAPYQNALLVVRVRNELIHFKPEWHDESEPKGLITKLGKKFPRNQLLPEHHGNPWTISVLCAGGATWAYTSARALVDAWTDRMSLTRIYETDIVDMDAQLAANW